MSLSRTISHWRLRSQRRRWQKRATEPLASLLASPLADGALDHPSELMALDLELTGVDPSQDQIVSIGWVPIRDRRVRLSEASHYLVRSTVAMGNSATIHHLRDCDTEDGELLMAALDRLLQRLDGMTLLIHGGIDKPFLDRACLGHHGAPLAVPVIDTLELERGRRSRRDQTVRDHELRLPALRARYGLPVCSAHHALADALATAELYLAMTA